MAQSIASRVKGGRLVWIAILLLVSSYFRWVAVHETYVDRPVRADALEYYMSAYNLVHYGVYSRSTVNPNEPEKPPQPDAYRWPGVPLMIAPFMSLWPDHARIVSRVQLVNIALGLITVAAIFFAASWVLPLPAAVMAGLLTACAPHLISLTVYLLSETPGAFCTGMLLAVAALGVPVTRVARIVYFMALGAIASCLALFRPQFVAFAPFIALAYRDRSDRRDAFVFGCLGAALVLAPWVIRNFLDVPPQSGPSLLAAALLHGASASLLNGQSTPELDALSMSMSATLRDLAHKFMAEPGRMLVWYLIEKPVYLFQWNNIDGIGDVFVYPVKATPFKTNALFIEVHDLYKLAHPIFLLLAWAGAAAAWWRPAWQWLPSAKIHIVRIASLLLAYLYIMHLPLVVNTRYSLPIYPAMFLLAVFAAVAGLRLIWKYGMPARPAVDRTHIEAVAAPANPRRRSAKTGKSSDRERVKRRA